MHNEDDATLIDIDRSVIVKAARKRLRIEGMNSGNRKRANSIVIMEDKEMANSMTGVDDMLADDSSTKRGRKKKKKKGKRSSQGDDIQSYISSSTTNNDESPIAETGASAGAGAAFDGLEELGEGVTGADESSIFGQTTGSSNATWVECDKCKKVSELFWLCFNFMCFLYTFVTHPPCD